MERHPWAAPNYTRLNHWLHPLLPCNKSKPSSHLPCTRHTSKTCFDKLIQWILTKRHAVGTNIICDKTWGLGVRKDLSKVISHIYNRAGVGTQNTCPYQPATLPLYWVHTLITSRITHYFKYFLAYLSVQLGVSALRIGSELHLFVFWAPTARPVDSRCCDNKWSTSQQGKKTRIQEEMGVLDKFRWSRKDARSSWENNVVLIGGLFWFCICLCLFVFFQVKLRPSWMTCQNEGRSEAKWSRVLIS